MNPLASAAVRAEMARAWRESQPDDPEQRHEEGGYILRSSDGSFSAVRWMRGDAARIVPPPLDAGNRYNGMSVLAAYHTHPNPPTDEEGRQWEQAPSAADRRWHSRRSMVGYVISRQYVYIIGVNADVSVLGRREEVL